MSDKLRHEEVCVEIASGMTCTHLPGAQAMTDLDRLELDALAAAAQEAVGHDAKSEAWIALVQALDPLPDTIRSLAAENKALREAAELDPMTLGQAFTDVRDIHGAELSIRDFWREVAAEYSRRAALHHKDGAS